MLRFAHPAGVAALALALLAPACSASKQTAATSGGDPVETDVRITKNTDTSPAFDPDEASPYVAEAYNASATRTHDLIHTELAVSFDWANSRLNGQATLTLQPYFHASDRVTLDAKGFDLHRVALAGEDGTLTTLDYTYDNWKLDVALPRAFAGGEPFKLFIDYTAKPEELPEGGSDAITSEKGLYFINPTGEDPDKPTQLWTQGETEASSCWFPTIDKPNERCTQDLSITVDTAYVTLSNGLMVSSTDHGDGTRTDRWVMDKPHAPYLFAMVVGEFSVTEDEWRGIPVDYYVAPEYGPHARAIFGNTPEMMTFYSEVLGYDYPWPKYSQAVVEDFVSGAMENTSCVIHYGGLHQTDRELLDGDNEDIIAHELFHHWFGDLVTCESWANLPLNESFATYGEYLWIEHKYGRAMADEHLEQDMELYLQTSVSGQYDLVRFGYGDKEDMFDGHSYQKGGRVLHMLRKYLGDEAFFAGLQRYLEENAYSDVEIHELRLAYEDVTGEDLNWFFNQWFLGSGHPTLEIDYALDSAAGQWSVTIRQKQKREETPVYRLPIDIDVYVGGKPERQRVWLERREQTFPIDVRYPDWINVDAEKQILGVVKDNQPEEWYAFALERGPLYLDRKQALEYYIKRQDEDAVARQMVIEAMDDPFWVLQERSVARVLVDDETPGVVRDKVLDLARGHRKADVRVAALRKLGEYENPADLTVFQEALQDSSWRVMGNGLRQMAKIESGKALEIATRYEAEDNLSMTSAVMNIYAEYGGREKDAYFRRKLAELGGWEQYLVIQAYGDFLERQEDFGLVSQGCQMIAEAAEQSDIRWMTMIGQGTIRNIKDRYEEELADLEDAEGDFASRIEKLNAQIAELDAILDAMRG